MRGESSKRISSRRGERVADEMSSASRAYGRPSVPPAEPGFHIRQPLVFGIWPAMDGFNMLEATPGKRFPPKNQIALADRKVGPQHAVGIVVQAPSATFPELLVTMVCRSRSGARFSSRTDDDKARLIWSEDSLFNFEFVLHRWAAARSREGRRSCPDDPGDGHIGRDRHLLLGCHHLFHWRRPAGMTERNDKCVEEQNDTSTFYGAKFLRQIHHCLPSRVN